jgi:hypothetical protein
MTKPTHIDQYLRDIVFRPGNAVGLAYLRNPRDASATHELVDLLNRFQKISGAHHFSIARTRPAPGEDRSSRWPRMRVSHVFHRSERIAGSPVAMFCEWAMRQLRHTHCQKRNDAPKAKRPRFPEAAPM